VKPLTRKEQRKRQSPQSRGTSLTPERRSQKENHQEENNSHSLALARQRGTASYHKGRRSKEGKSRRGTDLLKRRAVSRKGNPCDSVSRENKKPLQTRLVTTHDSPTRLPREGLKRGGLWEKKRDSGKGRTTQEVRWGQKLEEGDQIRGHAKPIHPKKGEKRRALERRSQTSERALKSGKRSDKTRKRAGSGNTHP